MLTRLWRRDTDPQKEGGQAPPENNGVYSRATWDKNFGIFAVDNPARRITYAIKFIF